jgi:hypothetical protein
MHFLTIWSAVYLVCLVGGPSWRGYRLTLGATAVWAAAVLTFNAATGTNYGYLSRKPETSSLLDLFGPWPAYVAVESVVLAAGWALMTWPWVHTGRTATERPSAGDRPERHGHRRSIPPGLSAGATPPPGAHEHAPGQEGADARGEQPR